MKVIVAGSRDIRDSSLVYKAIEDSNFEITELVSGGANGVDSIGIEWANNKNIHTNIFLPDWNKYGKSAGPIRNEEMAKYADALILIWDGKSRGSANMLKQAARYDLKVFERVV